MTSPGHTPGADAPTTAPIHLPARAMHEHRPGAASPQTRRGPVRVFRGRPVLRRVVFVAGYETLSVLFTVVVLSGLLGHGGGDSTVTAILLSTVATGWNYIWNTLFEALERRRGVTGRSALARAVHAVGYEGGVLVFTIPLVALMLHVDLIAAAIIETSLLVFFLVFTVVYTWAFDRVFGLPDSVS